MRPLPRTVPISSLVDFASGLPDVLLLCPVRALRVYMRRTSGSVTRPRRLFGSPRSPSRAMSKNAMSYSLREVIVHSGARAEGSLPKAHGVRGLAASSAFFRNWPLR